MVQIVSSEISVNELIILKKYQSEIVLFFFPLGLWLSDHIICHFFRIRTCIKKRRRKKDCCVDKKDN